MEKLGEHVNGRHRNPKINELRERFKDRTGIDLNLEGKGFGSIISAGRPIRDDSSINPKILEARKRYTGIMGNI